MSGVLTLSTQALIKLQNIEQYIAKLLATTEWHHRLLHEPVTYRGQTPDGWTIVRTGDTWFYERNVTFTGASQNIDLRFDRAIKLRLVEQIFGSAVSRDFVIKKATSDSVGSDTQLSTQTGHTALSELDYDLGSFPQLSRLRFTYSNTTNLETVVIRVTAEEIYSMGNGK